MIATWVNQYIEQCAAFPNGAHDDLVDETSQALKRFMYIDSQNDSFMPGSNPNTRHYDFNTELGRDEDDDEEPTGRGFYG